MARYERENTRPVLAGDAEGAKPDPKVVVATVGADGKIQLGRLDLTPRTPVDEHDDVEHGGAPPAL